MTYTLLSLLWIFATVPYMIFSVQRLSAELNEMQQKGYSNEIYLRRFREKGKENYVDLLALLAVVPLMFFDTLIGELVALLLWGMAYVLFLRNGDKNRSRRAPVFTERGTRLYVVLLTIFFIPAIVLLFLCVANVGLSSVARGVCLGLIALLPFFAPFFAFLANAVSQPFEERKKEEAFGEAKAILAARDDLLKVAVTGSYGKTSAKQALHRMLEEKYYTLTPSGSYANIDRIGSVICEQLKPLHEAVVVEMGAREPDDMRELCQLVNPQYAMITALGDVDSDAFGTFDDVVNSKFALAEALPEEGIAVLNFDDAAIRANAGRVRAKVVRYGIHGNDLDYRGEKLRYTQRGTEFVLRTPDGAAVELRTRLLGEYNVRHIVGAAALAHSLGLSLKQIKRAVSSLAPMAKRLELSADPYGVYHIDDTACSNFSALEEGICVLREMEGGRKFLITSGLWVDEKENKDFGAKVAAIFDDIVMISGDSASLLRENILAAGFPADRLISLGDRDKAKHYVSNNAKKGDMVLSLSDLSDTFMNKEA